MSEDRTTAATELLVELLLEGLAQQVEGKRVDAGVGEGQDTSDNAAHEVDQGGVHLVGENMMNAGFKRIRTSFNMDHQHSRRRYMIINYAKKYST